MNLRRILRELLGTKDTPERTALAFSIGVWFGFSPLLGLHTILGVASAFIFRLNRVAVLLGVYSNLPWIIVPYYGFVTWLGFRILGFPEGTSLPEVSLRMFRWDSLVNLASQWRLLLPPFIVSTVLCTLLALLAYPASLYLIRRYRN